MSRTTAVRVACQGEAPAFVRKLEQYNILLDHDIFAQGELSHASVILGIPLIILKVRPSLLQPNPRQSRHVKASTRYGYTDDDLYYPNHVAMYLMSGNAETAHMWGACPGSILIARQDSKNLHTAHISVLMDFIDFAYKSQHEGTPVPMLPQSFKAFYERAAQNEYRSELAGVPSPFETTDSAARRDSALA